MPVADPAKYFGMLDRARKGKFAYPAINVTSLTTGAGREQERRNHSGVDWRRIHVLHCSARGEDR